MEGEDAPSRAVVVDDQVVDADDLRVGAYQRLDLLHELGGGGLAQQGVDGIPGRAETGPQDEQRHRRAAPAVDLYVPEMSRQGPQQHGGGSQAVAEAVHGGGGHGGGGQLFSCRPVVVGHVQLYRDGDPQDYGYQRTEIHRLRGEDLLHGGFPQFHAHQQDYHRDYQPGDILPPAVAEGVVPVRGLGGQLEAQEGDHGGPRVRKVVHRVGGDGDGAAEDARQELPGEEKQVQRDAYKAAEDAVGAADRLVGGILIVLYEMLGEKMDHGSPRFFLPPLLGGGDDGWPFCG